jgi:predicted amidohydrolase YtcJ
MGLSADIILTNANVLTLDSERPEGRLVVIKDKRILGVGEIDDFRLLKGPETKVIDCQGKTLVPGFIDAHCHPLALAAGLLAVDCRPTSVTSISEIQDRIRQQAQRVPEGTWIKAVGYNEYYLAEKRHPTRWDLDEAAPNHPVKLTHRTGHACVLNSLALRLTGISSETEVPSGALMERDLETGEPNGFLVGMNDQVDKAIPAHSQEEREKGMRLANLQFVSNGITSIHDASWTDTFNRWKTLRGLRESGVLQIRVCAMIGTDVFHKLRDRGFDMLKGDERLSLGAVKIIVDEVSGSLNPPQDELNQLVYEAHESGFQVALHCVEQSTVEAAVTAVEEALKRLPKSDHRHRLEHCSVCPPRLVQRIKSLQALVVTQPLFLYYGGERYLDTVPPDQLPHLYAMGSWVGNGVTVAAGSDTPVVPLDTMAGICAAVTRRAQTGQLLGVAQRISTFQALQMHTSAGAYASFDEEIKGSISPGKLADIVLLSDNPTRVLPEALKDIQVLMTIIDGQIVWEK